MVEEANTLASEGVLVRRLALPRLLVAHSAVCGESKPATAWKSPASMQHLHILSAASIAFARSVNDAPKLAALVLASGAWQADVRTAFVGIALAMTPAACFLRDRWPTPSALA
ncbi:MAG: hypothetical protein N3C12_00410 [Candidatus Binatia bacterium]|nr:hypothetical protein [Candidatus Binatia bacterium]